ncbi:Krueppel-like factor 5 [Saguinus oedipus]|uniref:Krueppel-like factor 5 n=1 Tax=Saguinus oedipus TaxID=9490 RepID=A0ABQ9WBG9_SAGOE|nr:Krueppel-like factor 5 [Saguinus oedipus]
MATRVLSMSARLGPVPQPPAPQDEPVFAQLKPVLGAANPARDAALFPGEELKHPHHRPQAQPAPQQAPQPAQQPAAGPRLPPEELVQHCTPGLGRVPPLRRAGDRGRSKLGRASGRTGAGAGEADPPSRLAGAPRFAERRICPGGSSWERSEGGELGAHAHLSCFSYT